jgi:hypothetical protein
MRLHVDRLELDLHGIAPHAAEATARLLAPALAQALAERRLDLASTKRMDVGCISIVGEAEPANLAKQLAQRIADKTTGD